LRSTLLLGSPGPEHILAGGSFGGRYFHELGTQRILIVTGEAKNQKFKPSEAGLDHWQMRIDEADAMINKAAGENEACDGW